MNVTLIELAHRLRGLQEVAGDGDNPLVTAAIALVLAHGDVSKIDDVVMQQSVHDETAWCSAALHLPVWLLGLPAPWSLRARSWLLVGQAVSGLAFAQPGDVAVFTRGEGPQPGPEVIDAPGHVGLFERVDSDGRIQVFAGNQGNEFNTRPQPPERLLGLRRLG